METLKQEKLTNTKEFILFKRIGSYLKPHTYKVIVIVFCIMMEILAAIGSPLVLGKILINLINKNYSQLIQNIIYLAIFHLIEIIIPLVQAYFYTSVESIVMYDIRKDIYNKILRLPIKAFDEMRAGEFISRINGDVGSITNLFSEILNIIKDMFRVITVVIVLAKINMLITIITLLTFPSLFYLFVKFGKYIKVKRKEYRVLTDDYISNIQQSLVGIREIKSLGIIDKMSDIFITLDSKLKFKEMQLSLLNVQFRIAFRIFNRIFNVCMMLLCIYLIYKGNLKVEYFLPIVSYVEQFNVSLKHITEINAIIQQSMVSFERIFEIIDNVLYKNEKFGTLNKNMEGNIIFKDVCFEYNSKDKILDKFNLKIEKNKKTAIVGRSGCGKSTIFNLLTKFYEPQSGNILIDGINIRNFSEESLRKNIAIIRQESFMFNMSIKENFLLINDLLTDVEIEEACKKAYIHNYIISLPDKYNTIIDENATNLSGGQKQRISIARALLKKSNIMLFDEATSALDNESQYYIKKCIDEISKSHTVIMIAHRFSTIIDADCIIVIENGKVIGKGTHDELMHSNEIYISLYKNEMEIELNTEVINCEILN